MNWKMTSIGAGLAICLAGTSWAADPLAYSRPVGKNYPVNVYWGDTHLHTNNSSDAYSFKNRNISPVDAYRFARGEEMVAANDMKVRLQRPLDFLVVADHAEYLDGYRRFDTGDPVVSNTTTALQWRQSEEDVTGGMKAFVGSMLDKEHNPPFPASARARIWEDAAQTADRYNEPGRFTALIGYEWTSMVNGNNLHRVVVFKDGADTVAQLPPFSAQDSLDPRDLWNALAKYEATTGGEALAIAHNGNLSNGMMFSDKSIDGKPLTRAYAEMRARWEPIYEVTQVKGDGETHPVISPNDEFADFENWDRTNILRTQPKEDWMLPGEYARGGLKRGLKFEASLGANPYKFGMIGSTDIHTGLSTAAEDNFFGKFPKEAPGRERIVESTALWKSWELGASGLAAVWARENTREALFDAMKRKEVYATTGSRIMVRFFGGWDYPGDADVRPDYVDIGYTGGVPMGGDLADGPAGKAPTFIVVAAKDPDEANLDRVQIVKGWLDADGNAQEKVYDVALSDDRKVDPETGKAPPVGSTVNVGKASYTNTIGAPQLSVTWTDPDFDPVERAFYYVRVIEIPKPRWTAYDAAFFDIKVPAEVAMTVQDRAYSSPIWYTPAAP